MTCDSWLVQEEKKIMDIVKAESLAACQPEIAAFAESLP
jgi:hypothetical protein